MKKFLFKSAYAKICSYIGENYRKLYAIILWIAMFTTALANGFGFINKNYENKNKIVLSFYFVYLQSIS